MESRLSIRELQTSKVYGEDIEGAVRGSSGQARVGQGRVVFGVSCYGVYIPKEDDKTETNRKSQQADEDEVTMCLSLENHGYW